MSQAIAKSLNELQRRTHVAHILLRSSEDLICRNLFCEKVTLPCICRLERTLQMITKNPESLAAVRHIDISGNGLSNLPPSLNHFHALETLNLSNNSFVALPVWTFVNMPQLTLMDIRGNNISALLIDELLQKKPTNTIILHDP